MFIWYQDGRFHAILKDMQANYTPHKRTMVLFESPDAHDWQPFAHSLVSTHTIRWEDGTPQNLSHFERPQLYCENGKPAELFCAADKVREHSFNVHISLKWENSHGTASYGIIRMRGSAAWLPRTTHPGGLTMWGRQGFDGGG